VLPYWRRLALVLLLSFVSTGLALLVPMLARELVDRALLQRDAASLLRTVLLFLGMTAAAFALNVAAGLRYTRVSAEILFDMRLAVYRHLQRLSPRFYARARIGDLVSRVGNDIAEVQRVSAETLLASVGNVLFLVGSVVMLMLLDARLFAITLVFLPPALWALTRYRSRLSAAVTELRQRSADIGSFLVETLQGMRLTSASNAEEREAQRFREKNDAFLGALHSMQLLTYLSGGLPGLILAASAAAVFWLGGSEVIAGRLSLGSFVAFMAYQARLLPPLQALMGLYAGIATARVSLERVQQLMDVKPDVIEVPGAEALPDVRGEIAFEDVTLAFDRGAPVLDGASFHVRAGEVVAVVGESGSGKSTIGELLLRQLDPDTGTVRLDGRDLRRLRVADVRRRVALVEQEPFLFHATIAENIRYGRPDATAAEVQAAALRAGIHAFVDGLPEKYETLAGERGRMLSAGERQRIAIARAFLADPAVLVLDEPTAALDPVAERQVVAGYEELMRGRTTILISHRFLLASRADRVIVLEGARIVEDGPPRELLRRGERFARLFAELRPAEGGLA
jgi:ATP-binding cassette subfamily B protein